MGVLHDELLLGSGLSLRRQWKHKEFKSGNSGIGRRMAVEDIQACSYMIKCVWNDNGSLRERFGELLQGGIPSRSSRPGSSKRPVSASHLRRP